MSFAEAVVKLSPMRCLRCAGISLMAILFIYCATRDARAQTPGNTTSTLENKPPSVDLRAFWFKMNLDLSETYTTNALGSTDAAGGVTSDFISRAQLDMAVHDHTDRFTANAEFVPAASYFVRTSSPIQVDNYFTGLADAILVPENLFLDVRAFAQPVYISRLGPLAPSGTALPGSASGNVRGSYGFQVQPRLSFRFGDWAKSDLTPSYGADFFLQQPGAPEVQLPPPIFPPPSDMQAYAITEKISSGDYFQRTIWDMVASDKEQTRNAGGLVDREGIADFYYGLSRHFWLLATGGYEYFHATPPLTRDINGYVALGGLRVTFGPAFDVQARAGHQYNSLSYTGDLHWEVSPIMSVVGGVTDTITTPAHLLLENLANLSATDQGTLYDDSFELSNGLQSAFSAFNAAFDDGTLSNSIERFQSGRLSLLYETLRTHFRLTVFGIIQTDLSPLPAGFDNPHETTYGVTGIVGRDITRRLTGAIDVTYSLQDIFGGRNDILNTGGTLTYSLNPLMQVYFRTTYLTRLSSQSLISLSPLSGNIATNTVTIGIRRQIF